MDKIIYLLYYLNSTICRVIKQPKDNERQRELGELDRTHAKFFIISKSLTIFPHSLLPSINTIKLENSMVVMPRDRILV